MQKQALSDDTKQKLKTTAKVVAMGAAGASLGSVVGRRLGSTTLGSKLFSTKPAQGIAKLVGAGPDLSKAKSAFGRARMSSKLVSPGTVGGILGAHAFGIGGDFAAIASSGDREKRASMSNIYLEKLAGAKLNALADGAGKFFGRAGPATSLAIGAGTLLGRATGMARATLKTPVGKGVAIGAGLGAGALAAKKIFGSTPNNQNNQ